MRRVVVLGAILVLAVTPSLVSAQGLFDMGFSQLGGIFGWDQSWCRPGKLIQPCALYVGYSADPANSMRFSLETQNIALGSVASLQHSFGVRGLWLGASNSVQISDRIGILGSFWYLVRDEVVEDREKYNQPSTIGRTWSTDTEWWFADVYAAYGSLNGFALLAGFRYDYFTTRFRDPFNVSGIISAPTDKADLRSESYIPLIGGQTAYSDGSSSFVFRVVGSPIVPGRLTYLQSFAGAAAFLVEGNYSEGYFVEAFTEYAHDFGGLANVGFFGRVNAARYTSDIRVTLVGIGPGTETYDQIFYRNSWTVGVRADVKF